VRRGERDQQAGRRADREADSPRREFRGPATDKPRRSADERGFREGRSAQPAPRRTSATTRDESTRASRKIGAPVKRFGAERGDAPVHEEHRERPARNERVGRATGSKQFERSERSPSSQRSGRFERSEPFQRAEAQRQSERPQRSERLARPGRPERTGRDSHSERDARSERTARGDAPSRAPRPRTPPPSAAPTKRADAARAPRPTAAHEHAASSDSTAAAGTMRLSKRMSELGLCSRREADEWIENGWVRVDGVVVDTLGARVTPEQQIEVSPDARAAQARQVTILLNKPVGYVSGQAEDGYQPAVTLITPANHWEGDRSPARFSPSQLRALAPAGRLDIDSTGLLVLTQDGRIAKLLIGEHSGVEKEYLVRVTYGERTTDIDRHFPAEKIALLRHGLSLDDTPLKPAKVSWQNGEQLRFVLREGKKRQIRRMCELVGLQVVGLRRVRMGRVALGALPQGQWRYLLPDEVF
jgi:23S rRNA pseudouridine2604 synthase